MYSDSLAWSLSEISVKPEAFQSSLALFCSGTYFFNFSTNALASDRFGILKKAASTNHDQSPGTILFPSACNWFSKFVRIPKRMEEFIGTSFKTPFTVNGLAYGSCLLYTSDA